MSNEEKVHIFRWDVSRREWYKANRLPFTKRLTYSTARQAEDAHPGSVFIDPNTINPAPTVGSLTDKGY